MNEGALKNGSPAERRPHRWYHYASLALVVLAAGLIGVIVASYYYSRWAVLPVVDDFLTHIDRGQPRQAYRLLTPRARSAMRFPEFKDYFESLAAEYGKHQQLHATDISLSGAHGGMATLEIAAQFEHRVARVRAVLLKREDRWRIDQIKIDREEVQTCPRCGAEINPADDERCERCGKRLKSPAPEMKRPPGQRVVRHDASRPAISYVRHNRHTRSADCNGCSARAIGRVPSISAVPVLPIVLLSTGCSKAAQGQGCYEPSLAFFYWC